MITDKQSLNLQHFLPYRLTKLTGIVSRTLAERYSEQFDLTVHEWRIIAIVGEQPGLTARKVGDLASLDKVNISRAIDRLEKSGRIQRQIMAQDRRSFALHLTKSGQKVLEQIIPLALEFEQKLLQSLSDKERESLTNILGKLDLKADELALTMKKGE